MIRISTSDARKDFAGMIKQVRRGNRVALERHGDVVAVIVSPEDLALLETIEDCIDRREAARAKERVEREGAISWEDLKEEMGL